MACPSVALDRMAYLMYELISLLGANEHNRVYKARELARDRIVALKVLWPSGADINSVAARHLELEARAMAASDHLAVLRAYSFDEFANTVYLAMEFAEGGSLAQHLGVEWPYRNAAKCAESIAHGVARIHACGLAHRAIAARHVYFDKQANPKLGGFGSAKAFQDDFGDDIATDLHDLGVVLYEMLTTPSANCMTTAPTSHVSVSNSPDTQWPIPASVPTGLQAICLRCLAKSRPYDNASELARELHEFSTRERGGDSF
jgi:serine/threonine protein kinase